MSQTSADTWAIVTGAASGIGEAVAKRFLRGGWGVLAMDLAGEALRTLEAEHRNRVIPAVVDVVDREAVAAAIDASGIASRLAAAVTAAGIYPPTNLLTFTDDLFHRIFDVNVLGTLNVAAEAIARFRQFGTKGAVVTISSSDAFTASTEQLLYSASKASVVSLTRVLARTVAREDIIVNGVAPGWVNTPGNAATGRMVGAEKDIPMGRVAQPDEIAEWVWVLASRESVSFMTGETIKINGGQLMS